MQKISAYAAALGSVAAAAGQYRRLWAAMRYGSTASAQFDWNIYKKTRLTEKTALELRGEFYNIFNNHSFQDVQRSISSAAFGQYTTTSQNARLIQLGARLEFSCLQSGEPDFSLASPTFSFPRSACSSINSFWFNREMRYIFALVTLVFLCPAVYGQFSGRVTGTVVDATGAAVPNAEVQLSSTAARKRCSLPKPRTTASTTSSACGPRITI